MEWWTGENPIALGSSIIDAPSVYHRQASELHHRIDIFARGTDNRLWSTYWDWDVFPQQWTPWAKLDDFEVTSSPALHSSGHGELSVFARGTDGQVWQKWWTTDKGWRGFVPLGGQIVGPPAARSYYPNDTDLVARGTDDRLWIKRYRSGHWEDWTKLDDFEVTSASAIDGFSAGRSEYSCIVVRGADGQVWLKEWNSKSGWGPWETAGGPIIGAPAAQVASGDLDLFVVARGMDDRLWVRWRYKGLWREWAAVGDLKVTSSQAIDGGYPMQLYARGADGQVWRIDARLNSDAKAPTPSPLPPVEHTVDFELTADAIWEGVQSYYGCFPGPLIIHGPITRINVPFLGPLSPSYSVYLLKPGHTTAEWADPAASVRVDSGGSLHNPDLKLFTDPAGKSVCVRVASTLPVLSKLKLSVTYSG